jgi:hypothetical protein
MLEKFKEELQKAHRKNEAHKAQPNSPEAKASARKGGAAMLVIGLICLLAAYLEWNYSDGVHIFFPVAGVVLIGFGLHIALTGKMRR